MRKILLTAACLFVASQAQAVSLKNISMDFYDASNVFTGYTTTVTGFVNSTAVTGHLVGDIPFFAAVWSSDVVFASATPGVQTWLGSDALGLVTTSGTVPGTSLFNYTFTLADGDVAIGMYFDWSTNLDIPVLAVFHPDGAGNWTPVDQVWYKGTATTAKIGMQIGPFPGQFPKFSGETDDPPVITLLGDNPVILLVGDPAYDEANYGATAADTEDLDLTADIVVGGCTPDTSVADPDGCEVTYTVADSTGQETVETRTVFVNQPGAADEIPPVITLVGASSVNISLNSVYVDAGVTASDNVDGVITSDVVTVNPVDTAVAGVYTITYNVSDTAGNPATQVTRTVTVLDVDTVAPVLTLVGADAITLEVGATFTDPGYTATDNIDGNIHDSVVVSGETVDTAVVGEYTIFYNVEDAAGNPAPTKTRIVNVVAAECAVRGAIVNNFTMYDDGGGIVGGSNTVSFAWDGSLLTEADVDPATHLETVPGNATLGTECLFFANPWTADPVWVFGPGTYTFDACPAGAIPAGVNGALTDGSSQCAPGDPANLITLTVPEGKIGAHMLFSWSASVNIDMIQLWDIEAVYGGDMAQDCGGANANRAWDLASTDINGDGIMGAPFVDGPFKGFSGNLNMMRSDSETASLPTDVPVLEIQGDNPLALALGDTFTCPSALAEDMVDGALCDQVTSVGCDDVDTSVPGAYTVTYQVVDSDGNKVSHDLLAIVFGPAADVPTGNLAGANPLVTFGLTADHPVVIMNSALDAFGNPKDLINADTSINVEPCVDRDCISSAGFNVCTDPGASALDLQDGALTGANFTTTIEKLVGGSWVVSELDCSVPAQYRFTYTASDAGTDNPVIAVVGPINSTTAVRSFNVNATPTADEQLPAEQFDDADVGGGCSLGNGSANPMQRADLLLLGGFLAALGLRRVKRSDV